jgi:hypothetical protein
VKATEVGTYPKGYVARRGYIIDVEKTDEDPRPELQQGCVCGVAEKDND